MDSTAQISTNAGNGVSMKDLLGQSGFDLPKVGDTVVGEIISVSKNNIFVDLGSFGTGIVYPGEFYDNPSAQKELKANQQISTILLDIETDDGFRELSLKKAQKTTAWQTIKKLKESGEIITAPITNINKGGAIVEISGIQGFLPLSQLSNEHYPKIEGGDTTKIVQALQKLKNKEIKVRILNFSETENKLIVSEKAVGDDELKKKVGQFSVGDIVEGTITGVTDFGAFMSIEAPKVTDDQTTPEETELKPENQSSETTSLEGLIHISEIDWKLIDDPRTHLKRGQRISAKIISIDGTKISLSVKALKPDPWKKIDGKYSVGQVLEGTITKINNYGVFAALDEDITGLIPASEFTGKKPGETLKTDDKISVAIVSIDQENHKMLLTLTGKEGSESKLSKETNQEEQEPAKDL